jgi:hypothetical protein
MEFRPECSVNRKTPSRGRNARQDHRSTKKTKAAEALIYLPLCLPKSPSGNSLSPSSSRKVQPPFAQTPVLLENLQGRRQSCFLLKASNWNLRLVQKQLGHSSTTTTQDYADVMMPNVKRALDHLPT